MAFMTGVDGVDWDDGSERDGTPRSGSRLARTAIRPPNLALAPVLDLAGEACAEGASSVECEISIDCELVEESACPVPRPPPLPPLPPPPPRARVPPPARATNAGTNSGISARGLEVGDRVANRYRLEKRLGVGGMGEVWAAVHETIGTRVALKVLLPYALSVPEIVARFEREAVLMGRVRSRHVPGALDFFVDPDVGPVLITDLVEGQSLEKRLRTPLTVEEAIDLGIDLASGLSELHRASVVHRDLKPGNVILRDGAPEAEPRAVIIDLGVSRLFEERADPQEEGAASEDPAPITATDIVVGTPEYMAPEQVVSCKEVTPAADIYALGALLFRAVTGTHVFASCATRLDFIRAKLTTDPPPMRTGRRDPAAIGLAAVVAKALEREPSRRQASAQELRDALLRLRKGPSVAVVSGGPPASVTMPPRRRAAALRRLAPAPAALMFALLMIAAAVSGLQGLLPNQPSPRANGQPDLAAIDGIGLAP